MVMSSFSSAMLVGGGSGVTFTLSQAEELVQAVREGKSALKFIEIIWITQDQGKPLIKKVEYISKDLPLQPPLHHSSRNSPRFSKMWHPFPVSYSRSPYSIRVRARGH